MEQLRQCMLCKAEPAGISCPICGALVGQNCFDAKRRVCKACVKNS